MKHVLHQARQLAGVMLFDWPRYQRALARPGGLLALHNRHEHLEAAPDGSGYRCLWQWSSDLHAPRILPALGRRILDRALALHPVRLAPQPGSQDEPQVSFVIGHRGVARLPLLLLTLQSLAGQQGASVECIVVEQDAKPLAAASLPAWVRHVHAPPPREDMPYARSWAFNIGVNVARAPLVVLHDNDMLAPAGYARALAARHAQGWEVIDLKRLVFYLSAAHTQLVIAAKAGLADFPPEAITHNLAGGGSIAVDRAAFARIGGMDESFIGWGGEDNEFWERAQTLKVWPYGCLPLVHLWHAAQPGKQSPDNPTLARQRQLSALPARLRIERLCKRVQGELAGPAGWGGEGS